jgi:PAS domain S-box-containing protein
MESQRVARLGSFIWDIASGLWTSSNILNDIFGIDETYTRSLEGWAALIHPDWRETMNVYVVNEVLGNLKRFDKEYKIINQKNGKNIWVHGLAELETDKNNQPIKLIGTITDITERKLAEEALKYSKSLMDAAFESVHNGILVVSEQGAVIKTNAKFAELWNIPGDLLSSADDAGLLDYVIEKLEDPVEFMTKISELYENPELESFDLIYFKDGRIFERISKPMQLESKTKGRVWSFLDITDQKQAEIALMKSEEKYRSLTENIGEGVCFVNEKELFVYANSAAEKIFGVDKSGLMGLCLNDFLLGENVEIIKSETQKRREGEPSSFEHEIILKDGSKKDLLATATPSFNDKKFIGTFCIFRDITDRKRHETEIKLKNEQLIQANAEKDKFFSIIAHDLRSPFQFLLGFTQLMVEDLPTLTSEQTQKMALTMRTAATKLFNLLNNLLEWSMMQQGVISFYPESSILLNGIVPIIELVRDTADKKMIRIVYDIPEDLRVSADAQMFKSLMSNLVFNAVKFTPKGGSVTIVAKPISDGWVEVSIKDTGIGMNKSIVDNLFRLDEQTNRKGTEGEPSSGLGLIICKDFIEKHGGKLWVESEVDRGSTFSFTLPAKAGA